MIRSEIIIAVKNIKRCPLHNHATNKDYLKNKGVIGKLFILLILNNAPFFPL